MGQTNKKGNVLTDPMESRFIKSKIIRVLPDGRTVVDANELLKQEVVKKFLKSLEEMNTNKSSK